MRYIFNAYPEKAWIIIVYPIILRTYSIKKKSKTFILSNKYYLYFNNLYMKTKQSWIFKVISLYKQHTP